MIKSPVLIVDDESSMRMALSEALTRSGYTVALAKDGVEAINQFKSQRFHLVIADVKMARMDGITLLKEVRMRSPETPVVMITGYGTIENAVQAMKEGAFDYILKPFSVEVIETVVNKALGAFANGAGMNVGRATREIVTRDENMLRLLDLARKIAKSKATVFIQGESGTGKELLARYIHSHSPRRDKPFVAINCAALPQGLLESELFGHERGSFTGATARKLGKFELANHSTLLLDEISEMEPVLQAKLLRVLQENEIDRVGGSLPVPVDVRIIATTNKDIEEMVENGGFRGDLFFRLNVISFKIPPLRERPGDIQLLVERFLKRYESTGRKTISSETLNVLTQRTWKGNVRELENVIERATLMAQGEAIKPEDLLSYQSTRQELPFVKPVSSLKEMEETLIVQALTQTRGNRTHAARILGINVRTLRNKLHEYPDLHKRLELIS